MRRTRLTWLSLVACVAIACGGLGWLSLTALRLEASEARARADAFVDERVRLALWRMDGRMARLLAEEAARDPRRYAEGTLPGNGVQLHFAVDKEGTLPPSLLRHVDPASLWKLAPEGDRLHLAFGGDYGRRAMQFAQNAAPIQQALSQEERPRATALRAVWAQDELLLLRRVTFNDGEEQLQGAWLDWPRLAAQLREEITDLLLEASLEPVTPGEGGLEERRLASLPVRLVPGAVEMPEGPPSTVRPVLTAAWVALVLALSAVTFLLFGALSLSERRAAFVSAVTHELRTPLTTFRMYAEMLAEGMVPDEAQRQTYFETLQRESNRLAHLVENVLAYARLERRRTPNALAATEVAAFFDAHLRRCDDRARECGMSLEVAPCESGLTALLEPSATEQILFNLVDNACKYARDAADKRIRISVERRGSRKIAVVVRDFGPGVARRDARGLFEPFSKSSEQAADSAPGVGLGLALSLRLARAMRGDLRCEPVGEGASFVLLLRGA